MKKHKKSISTNNKIVFFITLLVVFLDVFGFTLVIPILASMIQSPYGVFYNVVDPADRNLLYGFLLASYALASFLSSPVIGQLSDKYGRRRLLAISVAGSFISRIFFLLGILTLNLPLLFVSRVLDGITGGNITVANSAIADISSKENKARNFGYVGMIMGLGLLLGPFVSSRLSDIQIGGMVGVATPLMLGIVLCFIALILIVFKFRETNQYIQSDMKINKLSALMTIKKAFRAKGIKTILITSFLFTFGFNFFVSFINVYLIGLYQFSLLDMGNILVYIGVWVAVGQGLLVKPLSKKFSTRTIVIFGLILTGFGLMTPIIPSILPSVGQHDKLIYLLVPLFAASYGFTSPNIIALVSNAGEKDEQGEVLGINTSIQNLAQAIPPVLAAYSSIISNTLPLIIGGSSMIFGALILSTFYENQKTEKIFKVKK
ncbi:MFS transporter [bacterium]|nr:MAG: MFS transporter [bacterium]